MSEIPLQSRPVPHRQHWTVPVSREETLAVREKFRRVSWRAPNHKPKNNQLGNDLPRSSVVPVPPAVAVVYLNSRRRLA